MQPLHRAPAFRLHRVQRLLRAHLLGVLARHELTPEQYFVLMQLSQRSGTTQAELGDPVLDDRASVSRQLTSLEKRGLLERRPHRRDRRAVSVHLTGAGRDLRAELTAVVVRERERLFGRIPPDDLDAFHRVLDHLEARLEPGE